MSHAEIAFEELSPIEQQHFQLWATEIQAIAAKSKSKGLAKKPPRLVVIRLPQDAGALHASTDGGKLMISRDVLPACPDLRRYFIAHELGHVEGRHPWISFGAAAVAMLPVMYWSASARWFGGNSAAEIAVESLLVLSCVLTLTLYLKSMLFEWDADRRAARMLGPNGVAAMLSGIALVKPLRGAPLATFYDSKRDRLLGKRPSVWKPKG